MHLRSACLIASGMEEHNWRLQPWRYLTEVACQLAALGHSVTVLSDGQGILTAEILKSEAKVLRISSVRNPAWKHNHILLDTIHRVAPEILIWHLGLTSFAYQAFPDDLNFPIVGLFSNPVYHPRDLMHLGLRKLLRNFLEIRVHLAGSLIPRGFLRAFVPQKQFNSLVVQTRTTQKSLEQAGFWSKPIQVIPPGVDKRWSDFDHQNNVATRSSWGFNQEDIIMLYCGSLSEIRGLNTLLQAFVCARRGLANLKLVILSRGRSNEWVREHRALHKFLRDHRLEPHVKVISGILEQAVLVSNVAAADIITLPFELLPSDAPLSILEALALGKPVVTSRVACLPELVSRGEGYLAEPGDPRSLSEAIARAATRLIEDPENILPNSQENTARSWQAMGVEWSHYLQSL